MTGEGKRIDYSSLPWEISFGSPPVPAERNHQLVQLAARLVGGDVNNWSAEEWELAARYLAHALDIARTRTLELAESGQLKIRLPRGRPRKGHVSLADLVLRGGKKLKRKPGRPVVRTEEDWVNIYDAVKECKQAMSRKNPRAKISDVRAIAYGVRLVAAKEKQSEAWIARTVREMQKLYSESKKRVRKIKVNS